VCDPEIVDQCVRNADLVVHAAARNIIISTKNPREDFQTNIGGTLNVLMAARKYQVERLVPRGLDEVAILSYQRNGQPVRVVCEVERIPALDAELAFRDDVVARRLHADKLSLSICYEVELAASAAIGTSS